MELVIIIAIAVVGLVAVFFTIQFLIDSDNEINIGNNILSSSTFDCAKQWEKYAEFYDNPPDDFFNNDEPLLPLEESQEISKVFFLNRCASTVNDWAYRTQNVDGVWDSGIDWEMISKMQKEGIKKNP